MRRLYKPKQLSVDCSGAVNMAYCYQAEICTSCNVLNGPLSVLNVHYKVGSGLSCRGKEANGEMVAQLLPLDYYYINRYFFVKYDLTKLKIGAKLHEGF